MKGINKAVILGTLGKDPEVRYMPDGDAVCNLSVATSGSWKDKNTGDRKEKTQWHSIVAFRQQAEFAGKYLKKGSKVYIEGPIHTRSYEKDGVTKYATEIKANDLQALDSRPTTGNEQQPKSQPQNGNNQPGFDDFDDSIPF